MGSNCLGPDNALYHLETKVKVSELINRLEELNDLAGIDCEVVIGETNGNFVSKIDVNAKQSNLVLGAEDDFSWTIIVQAYTIINSCK